MVFTYNRFRSSIQVECSGGVQSPKTSDNSKRKTKKEHKRKHKKRSSEKHEKSKKHKKHKKHKRKHSESHEDGVSNKNDKCERYTPEISLEVAKESNSDIINGKSSTIAEKDNKTLETDTDNVVSYVSAGLSNTHSLEIISSESEDVPEAECDSDGIDVSVIEADMDLEELMKQKELLQAEIAKACTDVDEEIASSSEKHENTEKPADEIILLDDSSNDTDNVTKLKRKRSVSRERKVFIDKKSLRHEDKRRRTKSKERYWNSEGLRQDKYKDNDRYNERDRSDNRSRMKAGSRSRECSSIDYRSKEHDRYKNREAHRLRERLSKERDNWRSREYDFQKYDDRNKDVARDNHRRHCSSRERLRKDYEDARRDRSRNRQDQSKDRRDKDKNKLKPDKYKDSLSEGQPLHASSSDSDELDIDINDEEEDEQKIIEKRRKQREELLKVCLFFVICCLNVNII